MKALTCEMCGSTNLIKQDGVFVCQQCGTKYSVEEAKKMMIEGTVSVLGMVSVDNSQKLENLYILGRRAIQNKSIDAIDYYKRILEIDPYSKEAIFMCDCFDIYEDYDDRGSLRWLHFYGHKTSKHTTLFSEDEKKHFFSIVGRYYFDLTYLDIVSIRIESGEVDERIQEWGECYKEEWTVIANQILFETCKGHNDDIPVNKRIECFRTVLNKLQELNPSMDLQEHYEKVSQMESDLHKLEQGIEPISDQPQKESNETSESQEKKSLENQEKANNSKGCVLPLLIFTVGIFLVYLAASKDGYDRPLLFSGYFVCTISILLYLLKK